MKYLTFAVPPTLVIVAIFSLALNSPGRSPAVPADEDLAYPAFQRKDLKITALLCPKQVKVAVVDTGVDYTHPELAPYMWHSNETLDQVDNDQNGYVDDEVGYDFTHSYRLPFDTHGHGTHIAGTIVGVVQGKITYEIGSDSSAVTPLTTCQPDVKIMALKYYDNNGLGYNNLTNTVKALEYAIENGADIINYSGGGPDPSESEKRALLKAQRLGILVVAAAGNDGRNNDRRPYFPASYEMNNIISVGASNKLGKLIASSNFGLTVDVAAPGLMLMSTLPNGKFGTMTGTSQATSYVSGLAAVIMSLDAHSTALSVKEAILMTAIKTVSPQVLHYGIVNPQAAVARALLTK